MSMASMSGRRVCGYWWLLMSATLLPLRVVGAQEGEVRVLERVRVGGRAMCQDSGNDGTELLALWSAAQVALSSSERVAAESTFSAELVRYTRVLPVGTAGDTVKAVEGPVWSHGDAFFTPHPADLASQGFVRKEGEELEYFAPDARAILGDAFAQYYCLWGVRGAAGSGEERGLGFRRAGPAKEGDVEGALWLSAEGRLRSIRFAYVGLPAEARSMNPGGEIEFMQLASGRWIVNRWHMRLPELELRREENGFGVNVSIRNVTRVRRVIERGGRVLRVASGERDTLTLPGDTLHLTVAEGGADEARADGAVVSGVDVPGSWILGSRPALDVPYAQPGVLRFAVRTPLMRALGLASDTLGVIVMPGAEGLGGDLRVPGPSRVARLLCGDSAGDVDRADAAAIVGRVVRVGASATHVRPRGTYVAHSRLENIVDIAASVNVRWIDSLAGTWVVCGVDAGSVVRIDEATLPSPTTGRKLRVPRGAALVTAPGFDASLSGTVAAMSPAESAPVVRIEVVSARDKEPIHDAEVWLGERRVRWAEAEEAYAAWIVPTGRQTLRIRRLGFTPDERTVAIAAEAERVQVRLHPLATFLPEMVIAGRRVMVDPRFAGVVERALSNWGTVITREDLRTAYDIQSLLEMIPGVRVRPNEIRFARCQDVLPGTVSPARVQVYVDGVRVTAIDDGGALEALRLVSPAEIEVVEVYRGVSRIPVEFLNDACAVIAIWTHPP